MDRHSIRPENGKSPPKSSWAARRLIRAALRKYGSQRLAAWALRLPNAAQLNRMLHGQMHDTPAMKAALIRAKKRAERAYYLVRADQPEPFDVEAIRAILREIDEQVELLKQMTKFVSLSKVDKP